MKKPPVDTDSERPLDRLAEREVHAIALGDRLADRGVKAVAMTMVDNGGVARMRAVPLRRLAAVASRGVGMSAIWPVVTVDDHLAAVPPYDSATGDSRLLPDLGALQILAAAPGWAWAPLDQWTQSNDPSPTCQRDALRRAVDRGRARGIEFRATYEIEMTLFDEEGRPAHEGPGQSMLAFEAIERFALDAMEALDAEGVGVEQCHPEQGRGQFEVAVAAGDPIAAADHVVLSRITLRQVARAHGLRVSFAPLTIPGLPGNGSHLHVSAWRDGANLMHGGSDVAGLTSEGASLIAGVLEALPSLLAAFCPSALSYLRLQPGKWAGATACWGVENREAALRLQQGLESDRANSANLEVKVIDGAANPYLAAALVLSSALDGLESGLELPDPVQADPGRLTDAERRRAGIAPLPTSLGTATDLFEKDDRARAALGENLHAAFTGVRRLEFEAYAGREEAELIEALRWRY